MPSEQLHEVIHEFASSFGSDFAYYQLFVAATVDRPFNVVKFQNVLHAAMKELLAAYGGSRVEWMRLSLALAMWCNTLPKD